MNENVLCKNNVVLSELTENVKELKKKPWYTHLHELRIEQYHNKVAQPSLNENRSRDRELHNINWLIPGIIESRALGRTHTDIIDYCQEIIGNVENILSADMELLKRYLSNDDSSKY